MPETLEGESRPKAQVVARRITFVGDIHGEFQHLPVDVAPDVAAVIQVGDFGFWPSLYKKWREHGAPPYKLYVIDGNHENFDYMETWSDGKIWGKEPFEFWPGLVYVPRGVVLEIENRKFAFLGGADSIDLMQRTPHFDWFAQERVREEDIAPLLELLPGDIDVLVTHAPPLCVTERNLSKLNRGFWDLSKSWTDVSAMRVERVWRALGKPCMFSGHVHKAVRDGRVRILDINERADYWLSAPHEVGNVRTGDAHV